MIKKVLFISILLCLAGRSMSQFAFPSTDSLHRYTNRFITNSAINAFTDYRMNTLLNGIINWIDSARLGTGGSVGVDTIYALNDSTIRYKKNGVTFSFNLRGRYWTLQQVLGNGSTLTSNYTITLADSLTFTSGKNLFQSVRITNLTEQNDTTLYKPIVKDANGNLYSFDRWPGGGSGNSPTQITEKKTYYRGEQYVNHVVDDDGTIDADTSVNITDYMPIEGSTSVTISSSTGENITIYGWTYDANLTPISEIRAAGLIGTQLATYTFTTPSNAAYINIYTKITGQDFHQLLRIQSTNTITYNAPVTPEQFTGANSSIKIQKALDFARWTSSYVELKGKYTIDSTIILSSGNTLVLNNAHVQLAVGLQNNMIRNESAKREWPDNFKRGNRYIKIIGIGNALFEGSYEDWGGAEPGWRSWTIHINNVEDFEIANLQFRATHGNVIDLVQSRVGHIHNLDFIESEEQLNQGGVEVIRGSNRITVENVRGRCQDDFVTLGNLAYTDSFHIDGPDILDPYALNLDVHDVIVRNIHQEVSGIFFYDTEPYFKGGVRLLSADSMVVRDCLIDGVTGIQNIYLQDPSTFYGSSTIDLMYNITITNTSSPIWINAPVKNCSFINVAKFDTSGTFQSAVPPDSSINITRKYYTESMEYNAFVGVNNWIKMSDQFGTNGNEVDRRYDVAAAAGASIRNSNASGTAQFRLINSDVNTLAPGISGPSFSTFNGVAPGAGYLYTNSPVGLTITSPTANSKVKVFVEDLENLTVTNDGVGIGETSPIEALHLSNFNGTMNQGTSIRMQQNSANTRWNNLDMFKSSGTAGSPTAVADGDILGTFRTFSYDGTSYLASTAVIGFADGTPSTSITPGRLSLYTRDGSGNLNENFRISADRSITVQSLANASAGIVTSTTGGVLGRTTSVPVANGGTGNTSLTAYAVLAGGTTSTGALQQVSGLGTSGQVLTSNGAGALPTWQNAGSYTFTNGLTNSSGTVSWGGTLTGTTTINGGGQSLLLGSGGSQLAGATIFTSGGIALMGQITYSVDDVTADANYTVTAGKQIIEVSDNLTTNRTFTMPSPGAQGQTLTVVMRFSAGSNHFSLASAITDNATGSTFTQLDWGKTYDFYVDRGTTWRLIRKY